AQRRYAEAAHAHQRAVLGSGRDLELLRAVEGIDIGPRAERRLGDRQRKCAPQLVAASLQLAVRGDLYGDVQGAGGSAARARGPPYRTAQPLTGRDSARDLELARADAVVPAFAAAEVARARDDLTAAAARRARRGRHHLSEQGPAHLAHLAGAVARGAPVGVG